MNNKPINKNSLEHLLSIIELNSGIPIFLMKSVIFIYINFSLIKVKKSWCPKLTLPFVQKLSFFTNVSSRDIFPNEIVTKHKTGWTAPVKGWIQNEQVTKDFYQKQINRKDCLQDIVLRNNETQKSAIPAWIMRDWANKFNMSFERK